MTTNLKSNEVQSMGLQIVSGIKSITLLMSVAVFHRKYINANPACIYIGLRTGLPELVGNPRTIEGKNKLDDLYSMVNYTNSFNSVVDDYEGMSRILKRHKDHPYKKILQAAMDGIIAHWDEQKTALLNLFSAQRKRHEAVAISSVFEKDLKHLVVEGNQDISKYSEKMCIDRRETDNAIFELACAASLYGTGVFNEEYQQNATFDQRYRWLLDESIPQQPVKRWLKALHKSYVSLGIFDDFQGIEDDEKLGLITYPVFLHKNKGLSNNDIRQQIENLIDKYDKEAEDLGMSKLIRRALKKAIPLFDNFITRKRRDWVNQELDLDVLKKGGVNYIREKLSLKGYLD